MEIESGSGTDFMEKRHVVQSLPRRARKEEFTVGIDYVSSREDE
jgi:hypothetical protein